MRKKNAATTPEQPLGFGQVIAGRIKRHTQITETPDQ